MQIWHKTNIQAHNFLPAAYWTGHYGAVQAALPQAEVYVAEDPETGEIRGFIGLIGDYVAGLFVAAGAQSKGLGKGLLDEAKARHPALLLSVYAKNRRAIRFYRREGFAVQAEGREPETGELVLTMAWRR